MSQSPSFRAITLISNVGRAAAIISDVAACRAHDPNKVPPAQQPKYRPFKAIWDTGATASVINQKVITDCNLKPTGMVRVHGVHGPGLAETFLVNIGLPHGVAFANVPVTRGKVMGADMLIGMDIITTGDFAITNVGGTTVFSFRQPSVATIDYVKDFNDGVGGGLRAFLRRLFGRRT